MLSLLSFLLKAGLGRKKKEKNTISIFTKNIQGKSFQSSYENQRRHGTKVHFISQNDKGPRLWELFIVSLAFLGGLCKLREGTSVGHD